MTKFEKISFEQYFKDMNDTFYSENYVDLSGEEGHGIKTEYEDIKLPKRATKNSAGYDFFAVEDIVVPSLLQTISIFLNLSETNLNGP